MAEMTNQKRKKASGAVRIRSNVCLDQNAWYLVPGDVLKRYVHHDPLSPGTQHDEEMYYERCSLCQRTLYELQEDGCDEKRCRDSGVLSRAAAAARRTKRAQQRSEAPEE